MPRLRVGTDVCTHVQVELYERPVSYGFGGRSRAVSLAVTPSGDGCPRPAGIGRMTGASRTDSSIALPSRATAS